MNISSVLIRRFTGPNRKRSSAAAVLAIGSAMVLAVLAFPSAAGAAEATVNMRTAGVYSVLAGSTVTNVPADGTVLSGDLGVNPGSAITGFPPGVVNGATHAGDAVAGQAQSDLTSAYDSAAGRTGADIGVALAGATTKTPGVYNASVALNLGGTLTLDGQGDPNAVFIFQVGSALTVDSGTHVIVSNGAQACNVFWQIGTSATLGTGSDFKGTIMALDSIAVQSGTNVEGRALARNGAVTLDNNVFTAPGCAGNTVTVTNPGSRTGTVGTADSLPIVATDSGAGITLTYSATGLPTGVAINANSGVISGTPTTAGTFTATVTATDNTGAFGSTPPFTWTISSGASASPRGVPPTASTTAATTGSRAAVVAGAGRSSGSSGSTSQVGLTSDQVTLANTGLSPMLKSFLVVGVLLCGLGASLLIAGGRSRARTYTVYSPRHYWTH